MLMQCAGEAAQLALGARIAKALEAPLLIFLRGDLGAGKTTLVRGLLRGLGWQGAVRSPTYTLIENYPLQPLPVFHLDLYRLADPDELEYLGLRDLLGQQALVLIEWPERGAGWLPQADIEVEITHLEHGRAISIAAASAAGSQFLTRLERIDDRQD